MSNSMVFYKNDLFFDVVYWQIYLKKSQIKFNGFQFRKPRLINTPNFATGRRNGRVIGC